MNTEQTRILLNLPESLTGERVILRLPRPGDGPALWEAINESRESLARWMLWWTPEYSASDAELYARRAAAHWLLRQEFPFQITAREGGRFLGAVGVHPRGWDIPEFEVGYWLRTSAHGRGYMSEAARLACDFAFRYLNAVRLFIRCDALNDRSAAVARRLGFVQEGLFHSDARDNEGALRDTLYFGMIAANWDGVGSP